MAPTDPATGAPAAPSAGAAPGPDAPPPLRWDGARLHVLDQTLLPAREEVLVLEGADDTAEAIARLAVRGAPLIGVAAAYGLAMAVASDASPEAVERAAGRLARTPAATRPNEHAQHRRG